MRIYSALSEETLRTRRFLAEWAGDDLISKEQYQLLEREVVFEFRTTNIFLRLVLFLFTLISIGAAAALFLEVLRPSQQTTGIFCLIFAALCYAAAETAVSQARLYHYGIEEALAVCSVGFFCAGTEIISLRFRHFSLQPEAAQFLAPAAGAVFSLWIWRRFGLSYAFLAAMIFVLFLPGYWTPSHQAQRGIIALFYAIGLAGVAMVRSRHRVDYLAKTDLVVEAFLWTGIYLALNLKLSLLQFGARWWDSPWTAPVVQGRLYWTTWVLIWCLPPIVLARGIRLKDRYVLAVGAIVAVLTLVSNKAYLGWPQHTWDLMFLGLTLIGAAIFVQRWLGGGPGGIRYGFTAARLSGKSRYWMNVGATLVAPLAPHSITPGPEGNKPDFRFDGGRSGGGGTSGEY